MKDMKKKSSLNGEKDIKKKVMNNNDYKLKQQRKLQKNDSDDDDEDVDNDEIQYKNRSTFTPGWSNNLSTKPALPIKEGSKIIPVHKDIKEDDDDEDEEDEDDDDNNNNNENINDGDDDSIDNNKKDKSNIHKLNIYEKMSFDKIRLKIADICTSTTADPDNSLKRGTNDNDNSARFIDMFDIIKHKDPNVVELAMISILIVFKNIIPSYKIVKQDVDGDVMLKKQTKKLRDFETMLLQFYQRYLKFLEETVANGLGSAKKKIDEDDLTKPSTILGMKALKCQCELIKAASHFNFRSILLSSIVTRAMQPDSNIYIDCCDTIANLFKNDLTSDLSYEVVQLIAKGLTLSKYEVPEYFLRTLEHVKMTVRADDASDVRKKAKQERKKRKRSGDDVDVAMLESSATSDKLSMKRFQAECMKSVILIYFRIIKMKIGFTLIPVALEGLGRISHLINMDTAEDLIALMKKILETNPAPPDHVKLHCILCAMRTLSGPGQELQIDDEVFALNLKHLMRDLSPQYERWDVVLECIDLFLLKKREHRVSTIISFVRLLTICASQVSVSDVCANILSLAHAILIRYPRVRINIGALSVKPTNEEDDGVVDLAMKALKDSVNDDNEDNEDDGSWCLQLLKFHVDPKIRNIVRIMMSKDIQPLPLRLLEAKIDPIKITEKAVSACSEIHSSLLKSVNTDNDTKSNKKKRKNTIGDKTSDKSFPAKKKNKSNKTYDNNTAKSKGRDPNSGKFKKGNNEKKEFSKKIMKSRLMKKRYGK